MACRRNTYLWRLHTNNSSTVSNCSSEVANCSSSAADNAIFKNRAQNIECIFVWEANILLFNFWEQKFIQHGPITIAIDCNGLSLLIFEEKWPNYAFGPKSAPNSESCWVCQLFNVCVRVFCTPNATILLPYVPAKIKMSFIWKDDFFFAKSASSVNRSQTYRAKRKRIEPVELCSASYQGVYAKFVWMMSPKGLIVENDSELMLMALHTYFLPQQQYSRVYALFFGFSRFGLSINWHYFTFFTR